MKSGTRGRESDEANECGDVYDKKRAGVEKQELLVGSAFVGWKVYCTDYFKTQPHV